MNQRFYRSIGLPLDTWRLVETAKTSPVLREVLGRYPTDSEVLGFLIKHGFNTVAMLDEKEATSQRALA